MSQLEFRAFDYNFSILVAKRAQWGIRKSNWRTPKFSYLWLGRLRLGFDQWHLHETEVHMGCGGTVQSLGEDGISYCEACECIVEGETEFLTESEYAEKYES